VTAAFVYCYDLPHLYSQDEQGVMAAFASQAAAALQEPRALTDPQAAFGVKTTGSVPKLQIIDAARPLVADMHRATGDEQARGEIEAARAQRQLETEQARLTADRTSLEADSRRVAQAQVALAAETERLAEARQALTLEADQLAATRGKCETEQALTAARRSESDAAWPSRRATLVASTVIAALATAVLGIGLGGHRPAVSTTVYKPAAQVSATAVQKRPLPAPHQVIAAGVVPPVAKAVVPHTTSRILPPPKVAYVVVVGAFESSSAAEEVMHLAQRKGYVVHVVLQGAVFEVMTAPMRTRTQAEGVARGLEAAGLHAQLKVWREQ
jgi:cell division septation protein DedD